MADAIYYRLEYNEKSGIFETNPYTKRKDNTYDWETIAMVISQSEIDNFLALVKKDFPQINSGEKTDYPNASTIKNMYNGFSGLSEL